MAVLAISLSGAEEYSSVEVVKNLFYLHCIVTIL